ncbi:MAG: sugar transferase [Smithellaceae bacterium]
MMNLPEQILTDKASAFPGNLMQLMVRTHENDYPIYNETQFHHMLRIERMRTERSKKPFLLLVLDISRLLSAFRHADTLTSIKAALIPSVREVDVPGWYHNHHSIGVIITEIEAKQDTKIERFVQQISDRFLERLDADWQDKIDISFHLFPEKGNGPFHDRLFNSHLYPDLTGHTSSKKISLAVKKGMDLFCSAVALILLSPLFLIIAAAIKATSPGPVLFRQERIGKNGKRFSMLKFRSMKTNCDSAQHQIFVTKFICEQNKAAVETGVYKLTNDSRITAIGLFLRKSSLDELPQFINVFLGEMSLVGPRPPLPYECDLYDIWHRRRLLSCKPGITGLWQVMGRSRTTFDDMVRLDLKYIRDWHLWLDIKILLMTPRAVLSGSGAL